MLLHLLSILYLFLLLFFISLSSYSKLFVASSYIVVFLLFSFLLWLSAFHTYNSSYSTSPNFWKSRIDVWWFVLISFPHFLLPYLVIFWPFNFSLFDLADSFYFETLGGVVECESPNPTDRGFVLHIGNCLGLEGSFSSPPYSSLIPFDETSLGPPAYSPPTSSFNPSSFTSTALVPIEPLPIWLACLIPQNHFLQSLLETLLCLILLLLVLTFVLMLPSRLFMIVLK